MIPEGQYETKLQPAEHAVDYDEVMPISAARVMICGLVAAYRPRCGGSTINDAKTYGGQDGYLGPA